MEEDFAERNSWKRSGQPSGGEHSTGDGCGQFVHRAVAIVEPAAGNRDADDRLTKQFLGKTHGARERSPQIAREIAVTVVR